MALPCGPPGPRAIESPTLRPMRQPSWAAAPGAVGRFRAKMESEPVIVLVELSRPRLLAQRAFRFRSHP